MTPETPFLEAIKTDAHDTTTRLVYADWLEEHGDPRAELIRIEEEMRPLPVFCDRFWQLKPRRHELLRKLPKIWLETMRYGTDCPPTFTHEPTGWKEWWRMIRVFTERWYRYSALPDVGGRAWEVMAAVERLGRKLPPSLREWVAFAHDIRGLPVEHDVLIPSDDHFVIGGIYRMEEIENQGAISLLRPEEGDEWAVHHEDLALTDPPVWEYHSSSETTFVPFNPVASTLTSFVLAHVLNHARSGDGIRTSVQDPVLLAQQLGREFPVHFRFGDAEGADRRHGERYLNGNTEIFEKDNILVQLRHVQGPTFLKVDVFKPLPRDAIPQCLWDQPRQATGFFGMFSH